jgi:RNA polymerase sigma factor for flagellar operon FliA
MKTAELAYRESSQDVDDRNELVMRELPQVYYIAARIHERLPEHVEMEDLVHAGIIGLIEACRNYDSSKNAQLSTFAKFRIRGAILDSLRKLDWGSRELRKQGRAINASGAKLASVLGRQPLQEEIAADLQISLDKYQTILTQLDGLHLVSQQSDPRLGSDEPQDLIESAQSAGGDNPFDLCLKGEERDHLAQAISQLSEREQLILSMYYRDELTMREISEAFGLAVSRISQIHAAALVKMRESLCKIRKEGHAPTGNHPSQIQRQRAQTMADGRRV